MPDPIQMIGADTSFNLFNTLGGVKKPTETLTKKDFKIQKQPGMNFGDFANGANSMLGSIGGGKIGDMLAGIPDMFGANTDYGFSEDEKAAQSAIRKGLEMIPGYGQLIAAATGAVDAIGTATGLNLSSVDQDTANRSGVTGTFFNKAMNMLPGNSMIWGGLSRIFGNNRTEKLNVSDDVMSMGDGFGGSMKDLDAAKNLGNKQLFFWQTNQANDFINNQKNKVQTLQNIFTVNTQRKQSDYYQDLQNQNVNRYAGENYLGTHVGKNGMKLMSAEEARRIVALKRATEENPEKLQNGGTIPATEDQSIIPEGKLHKELHHLDKVNPELAEDLTRKGIPVITVDENGETSQVAEVERSEWTWSKPLTDKIEALYAQWKQSENDELLLECGYAVAEELKNNTVNYNTEENNNGKEQKS